MTIKMQLLLICILIFYNRFIFNLLYYLRVKIYLFESYTTPI